MWIALDVVTRVVIGGSLAIAGVTKLISTVAWRQLWLASYRMLPRWLVRPVALALPAAEAGCGIAMLAGVLGAASAVASACLLAVLATAVGAALARHLEVTCHCLTMVGEIISWRGVGRNLILIAAACAVAWHGGTGLLGETRLGWPLQLSLLAAAVAVLHGAVLWLRAVRGRRAVSAIGARGPSRPGWQG
jgi:hypothetical protein